mmetsp:Transcript_16742/g.24289  ORF Transcript_16742/g.24289 Transcript_16742/m.24289 type:complete len:507 (+) Transcript_16742:82-1602(+)
MSSIPQFGQVQPPTNKLPSVGFSEIDFDFDFLTQYLLFDEAEIDSSDKVDGYANFDGSFKSFFDGLENNDSNKKGSSSNSAGLNNSLSSSIKIKSEKGQQSLPHANTSFDPSYNSTDSSSSTVKMLSEKETTKSKTAKGSYSKAKEFSSSGIEDQNIKDEDCTSLDTEYSASKKRKNESIKGIVNDKINKRRARNKVLAKQTRYRKKFFFESLQRQVTLLAMENQKLKDIVRTSQKIPDKKKEEILSACTWVQPEVISSSTETATAVLEPTDFKLMSAIQTAQKSFVITDPSLMDNPIIFASQGFLDLTGYAPHEVIGRNCRFLQGPETNRQDVQILSRGIEAGVDTSVCLLNYKADGTPFYNQIYVAPLRDAEMRIINYVGVQVEIKTEMMHDRMLIQKCTDLKPPNGPKSVPRTMNKKGSPVTSSSSSNMNPNMIINTINNTNINANASNMNASSFNNMTSMNQINMVGYSNSSMSSMNHSSSNTNSNYNSNLPINPNSTPTGR